MKISKFAHYLSQIETTSGRLEMTRLLAEIFSELEDNEYSPALYLLQGRLAPIYVPVEFNMSEKLVVRALDVDSSGKINDWFKDLGDIGLVAERFVTEYVEKVDRELSVSEVFGQLEQIALATGAGSQEKKQQIFRELMLSLDSLSARYAARVVVGRLRLGVSEKTMLDALSWAVTGGKELRDGLERAFGARADIGTLARDLMANFRAAVAAGDITAPDFDAVPVEKPKKKKAKAGEESETARENTAEVESSSQPETIKFNYSTLVPELHVTPGTPVASKLTEREDSAENVFKRMGSCLVQPKLDGMRAQMHYVDGELTEIYSRNQERLTESFPDIVDALSQLKAKSAIIDSEVIGYDYENQTYLSYHDTMTRRRKHDVAEAATAIPLRAMSFDLLYLNGEDLTQQPVEARVAALQALLDASNTDRIALLDSPIVESVEELDGYFREQIGQGLEGILIKKLGSTYDPGTRNFDWIKLKANTQSELVDTLDLVVIGYYAGNGERAKYGFGSLLTAVYDAETDSYYSVAKVGSGFTDDQAPQILADLKAQLVPTQPANVLVTRSLLPDYWVNPAIVIEVIADEITRSPAHLAAQNLPANFETDTKGKGLSLRFPRLKIWNRDKTAIQATSVQELLRMYELRKGKIDIAAD